MTGEGPVYGDLYGALAALAAVVPPRRRLVRPVRDGWTAIERAGLPELPDGMIAWCDPYPGLPLAPLPATLGN